MDRRITPRLAAVTLSLGLALTAFPVMAGDDSWSVAGLPAGGEVIQLVVDPVTPSNLYASSGPGVFKSTDSGATWTLVFRTLNPPDALVIEPENPNVLYVAYGGDAQKTLFKTTDGGQTWNEADNGIGTIFNGTEIDPVERIAVDPVNDGVAYAAALNTGVFKTTDGGQNWTVMSGLSTGSTALTATNQSMVDQIIVDPTDPNIVYVRNTQYIDPTHSSTALSGLYMSTDAGKTWNPTGWIGSDMGVVTLDPSDHTHLLTCTFGSYVGAKLQDSHDSGATWVAGAACPEEADTLAIDPTNPLHIFIGSYSGGLLESTDGGTTQTAVSDFGSEYIPDVTFDAGSTASPTNPPNVYVSTGAWGVFERSSGSSTWTAISQGSQGIFNVQVNQMLMGADGALYLASGGSGIYKSPDQGVTWTQVGARLTPSAGGDIDVNTLIEDPSAASTLYAGTGDAVYKTTDGGTTWTRSVSGLPSATAVYVLALDAKQTNVIYAGLAWGKGLYKSTDGGATWNAAYSGIPVAPSSPSVSGADIFAVATDPEQSGVVYAGTDLTGVYKSTDGGTTWTSSGTGIGDVWVEALAVDPSNSSIVYAATSTGFYKSTDAGATWSASNSGLNGYIMTTIQIDPNQPSTIYLSENYPIGYGQAGYVFVSTDSGATWNPLTGGTTSAAATRRTRAIHRSPARASDTIPVAFSHVVVDPRQAGQIYASGNDGRIYAYSGANTSSGTTSGSSGGSSSGGSSGKSSGGGTKPPVSGGSGGGGTFGGLGLGLMLAANAWRRRRYKAA